MRNRDAKENRADARGLIRRLCRHGGRAHSMVVNRLEIRLNFVNSTYEETGNRQDLIYI